MDAVVFGDVVHQRAALRVEDAPFILQLVNEPSWLRFIGDRGVKSLQDANRYILTGPVAMYERLGFGLYLVVLKDGMAPLGLCGLLKRDTLPEPDLGFALLPQYWRLGYAHEAAAAVLSDAWHRLQLSRILAITSQDNVASERLLGKLGFRYERMLQLDADKETLKLFAVSTPR